MKARTVALAAFVIGAGFVEAKPSAGATVAEALCVQGVASLREALNSKPSELAARSASRGDFRYLEWFGLGSVIPGIANQACVRQGGFFKWFEGTSDALCSEEHRNLYERSYAFAEQYNRAMASLRSAKGLESCNGG